MLTASPITENSNRPAPPTFPATTGPEFNPIPTDSAVPNSSRTASEISNAGSQRPVSVIDISPRRSENREKPVACVLVDVSAVPVNQRDNPFEEPVESRHDLDRTDPFCEGGEAADVDEHHRDLHLVGVQSGALKDVLGDIAVDVCPERLSNAFTLSQTRRHRVESDL